MQIGQLSRPPSSERKEGELCSFLSRSSFLALHPDASGQGHTRGNEDIAKQAFIKLKELPIRVSLKKRIFCRVARHGETFSVQNDLRSEVSCCSLCCITIKAG